MAFHQLSLAVAIGAAALPAQADTPLEALPYTPGLDTASMDRSVNPCDDFYAYACGGWERANPIPPDRASWDVYAKAAENNQRLLWGVLDEAARKPDAERTAAERMAGDAFAACMDEPALEAAGVRPLADDLAAIERAKDLAALSPLLGRLQRRFGTDGFFFALGAQQSFEDSEQVVLALTAGGLGLLDRDQYLATDEASAKTRRSYRAFTARLLELSGLSASRSATGARDVLRIETALAKASLTRVERREPSRLWHRTTRKALGAAVPAIRWSEYFRAAGAPNPDWLNVSEPAFFAEVERVLRRESLASLKIYFRFHAAAAAAPFLSRSFQNAHFDFYEAELRGTAALAPRWKRCVQWADHDMGEVVGQLFVARAFPADAKRDALRVVEQVESAMRARLARLDWMSEATRRQALKKLDTLSNKVGFPERWRDSSGLAIRRDDFYGNTQRSAAFEFARQLAKVGRPVDREEWLMTPATVNAYYDASMNDINFPAGVLLPPLWDPAMDLAPGYGNTGSTVGHELIHAFDDEGRQFDERGNLRDWWTDADASAFVARGQCIVEQYARYPVVDDVHINSKLTLGEDLADLAGTALAWDAWKKATEDQVLEPRDGLSPEQRFFVGFAQWACANRRPEDAKLRALTDVHSPARWRVNGVVVNLPDFARAFSCPPGAPMVSERPCQVW